jgi:AcrR family transcriptional regulator
MQTESGLRDPGLLDATRRVLERHGLGGTTLERVASEAGMSRMTLYRRGVSKRALLEALAVALEGEYRDAMWPALSAPGSGRERLELALRGVCRVAERNLELFGVLSEASRDAVFHERGREALTRAVFTAPLERLLLDGASDGSLREVDPQETATVLFNLVGFTYRHLRQGHRWGRERACRAVVSLALEGAAAR